MYYLLFYEAVTDYVERRQPYRQNHLAYAQEAVDRGELLLAGAYADPVDGAVLLFDVDSRDTVESFARNDPYVTSGVIRSWGVREWNVVIGSLSDR